MDRFRFPKMSIAPRKTLCDLSEAITESDYCCARDAVKRWL